MNMGLRFMKSRNKRSSEAVIRPSSRNSSFGFRSLRVYQTLIQAFEIVYKEIIPSLPEVEKYGLKDQLRRSSQAPIALLAEGYAKRRHQREWIRYLEDCIGECSESIAHLDMALRTYSKLVPKQGCLKAMDLYDKASRQLYKLGKAWEEK